MENYEVMAISEILYHLYDTSDFMQRQQQVLSMTRRFLSCSFASILHAGEPKPDGRPSFCRPVCDPVSFLPAEENYIRLSGEDHLLWGSEAGRPGILRESSLLSDEKRLSTPIYKACYEPFQVYDTLQANLFAGSTFLGVFTFYRTREEGAFTDEDVFAVQVLSSHLIRFMQEEAAGTRGVAGAGGAAMWPGSGAAALRNASAQTAPLSAAGLTAAPKSCGTDITAGEATGNLPPLQETLTDREREILGYLLAGESDEQITQALSISAGTLKKHLQHIYRKLGIQSRWELLRFKQ